MSRIGRGLTFACGRGIGRRLASAIRAVTVGAGTFVVGGFNGPSALPDRFELFCDVDLWINHAVQGYVQPLYNPDAEQWVALGHGVQPTMCPALSRPLSEYQQDQVFARHAEKAEQQENDDDV